MDLAYLKQAKNKEQLGELTLSKVKKAYLELADDYNRLIELSYIYCPKCGNFKSSTQFYSNTRNKSGYEHYACKACILDMATDYDKKEDKRKDNRDKTIDVFRKLDLPFIESDYEGQLRLLADDASGFVRQTAFQQYMIMVKSLPQYRNKTFSDSEFEATDLENNSEEDVKIVQKTIRSAKKRFGSSYDNEQLMFLENDYQDWINRYECNTKAQEEIFENLSEAKLAKRELIKKGMPTNTIDKQIQDWLSAGNLQPKQNAGNSLADSLTFGQLIEKWENEKPIPEPDPEFKDIDGIGKYIRVWFKGHLCRALGIDNSYSKEYDEYIDKYTVNKPEVSDEENSEGIYNTLFGNGSEK